MRTVEHRRDSIALSDTYYTEEGYLRDTPVVTTVGIFEYRNPDGSVRRELRLPEHVFSPESLASYKGKPVIITHNAGEINVDNVQQEAIGTMLSDGIQDGDSVRVQIVIHDTKAMQNSGLRELSLGYDLELDETPGTWNGQHYDAVQTNIRINHLALVRQARAGNTARLNIDGRDDEEGGTLMDPDKNTNGTGDQNVDTGGLTSEQLAEAIAQYKANHPEGGSVADGSGDPINGAGAPPAATKPTAAEQIQSVKDHRDNRDPNADPAQTIAQQDADIDALLGIIDAMQAASDMGGNNDGAGAPPVATNTDGDDIDAIVRDRLAVARVGDRLGIAGIDTMPIREAKEAIIKKVNPKVNLDGRSDAYIEAAYDLAAGQAAATGGSVASQLQGIGKKNNDGAGANTGSTNAAAARERMMNRRKEGK